jgi:hypothetical protein
MEPSLSTSASPGLVNRDYLTIPQISEDLDKAQTATSCEAAAAKQAERRRGAEQALANNALRF